MGELQCTLEFSIELQRFINVDLFQRGFYQVRTGLKISPKVPAKVEVSLPKNSSCSLVFPACIVNGTAVSKTFQILYKNEEVQLDDIVVFKVHMLVDGHRVRETLLKADIQVIIELWFTDQNFGPDQHNSIQCVSTRTLQLHFDPARGLHHHLPVLFDYFHLCAVTVTIHASLLALCQPYLSSLQKPQRQTFLSGSPRLAAKKPHPSSLETVLFGPQQPGRTFPVSGRLHRARIVHWELCSLLLSAYTSLYRKLLEYMKLLPPWQQLKIENSDCPSNLENLSDFAKECYNHLKNNSLVPPSREQLFSTPKDMETEDDFLVQANSDIAQLCGALILMWQQFLEIVVGREKIRQHLARQRHFQRVKRFAEAFFIIERTRESALSPCETSTEIYQEVTEALRRSQYLTTLPPLEVECVELDGDFNTLPVIYEEHYQETARRGSRNSRSSQSTISLCDVSFLVNESLDSKLNSERRSSQGSLGQKSRSPDISATPTSPSAFSWCPESFTSPVATKSHPTSVRKPSLKDKLLNNFKVEFECEREEYNLSSGTTSSRINHKLTVCSKIKLRSRTVNFLRQFKKPHFNQGPNSVVLLGVKKLDSTRSVNGGIFRSAKAPFPLENGIRHSQSTLSVVSTLYGEGRTSLSNSESMPDLTCSIIPPPPPPPRARFASSEFDWASLDAPIRHPVCVPPSPAYNPPERKRSIRRHSTSPIPLYKNSSLRRTGRGSVENLQTKKSSLSLENEKVSSSPPPSEHEASKKFLLKTESWKDPYDEVFINNVSSYKDIVPSNEQEITPAQPLPLNEEKSSVEMHSEVKSISSEVLESLPPLISGAENNEDNAVSDDQLVANHIYEEICPPSPPVQFRDPPFKKKKDKEEKKSISESILTADNSPVKTKNIASTGHSQDSCLTSLICQGTLFFPKPPAQFAGDDTEEESSKTNTTGESEMPSNAKTDKKSQLTVSQNKVQENNEVDTKSEQIIKHQTSKTEISYFETKCTILEMLTDFSDSEDSYITSYYTNIPSLHTCNSVLVDHHHRSHSLVTPSSSIDEDTPSLRRASVIGTEMISFVKAKEEFKQHLKYPWLWYSDFATLASNVPYFQCDSDLRAFSPEGLHLVICVHGLDGNSADLRLVRTYLELGLPTVNFEFLMSERNQGETFDDFETMTDRLVSEIMYHVEVYGLRPVKISFIGHSLGNIIIRSALSRPEMKPYLSRLHTLLSLSGPHLGTLYNNSGLVNMGMWFMQKWKKSGSLLQLAMKDAIDPRQTFLYKLSQKPGLEYFRNVLLFGSSQDRYVPLHSARIELCKPAIKDSSPQGAIYREMVTNLLQPLIKKTDLVLLRYDVHHALPSSANSLIGRAAHIAVLDSELFIEKFMCVCGLRYFS